MNSDESLTPESTAQSPNDPAKRVAVDAAQDSGDKATRSASLLSGSEAPELAQRVADLQQQEKLLRQNIETLQASYNTMLQKQIAEAQMAVGRLVKEGVTDLEQRKQTLQLAVEQLERRQERIRNEMRTTFAGTSQDLAIRVQGFKDYLVGSLQDLAAAAEQLQLMSPVEEEPKRRSPARSPEPPPESSDEAPTARFAEQSFQDQTKRIRKLLDQYRTMPDYYGPPWQLRRTFEPIHAERVSNWFFTQGGRGALRTMGSRLQNILIASAVISVLRDLYGDRLRTLVLGNSPERLGEWRRGLQDCLGISRADFGAEQGIVLFEAPEPLTQRADRLLKQKLLPLIIVDESEAVIDISLLQFPLWLAFAADPSNPMVY
jgi:chaperonin cofactor prefoldin